jgi:WD40 repeat protein
VITGEPAGAPIAVGEPTDYVAFSPEGSKFVTVTLSGKVRVWDATSGKPLSGPLSFFRFGERERRAGIEVNQPMEWQRCPVFSVDGKQLATPDGFRIHIWSEAGTKTVVAHTGPIPMQIQVAFNPDGTELIYVQRRGVRLTVYDLVAGRIVATGYTARLPCGLAVSPKDMLAVVPVSVGNPVLFDLPSATSRQTGLRIPEYVTRQRFTPDSRHLVTASWDGTARVWQMAGPSRALKPYQVDCGRADRLEFPDRRFSPDGKWVAVYDRKKQQVRVRRADGEWITLPGPFAEWYAFGLGPDGKDRQFVRFVAQFSPDGRFLATFHFDENQARFIIDSWELGDAGVTKVGTTVVQGAVYNLTFSGDGKRLGVSVRSTTYKPIGVHSRVDQFFVFDFPTLRKALGPVGGDLIQLTGRLALAHDGSVLVVGQNGAARSLACWNVVTGQRLPGGRLGPGECNHVEVGSQGDRVLVGTTDGGLSLSQWDVRTGQRAGPTILSRWASTAYSADQSRIAALESTTLASRKLGYRVGVFSAYHGDLIASLSTDEDFQRSSVWFSADDRRVIVHKPGTTHVTALTLPDYAGSLNRLPALVRLLTGTGSDPVGGFLPLQGDAIRSDPETYRGAFRDWKELEDRGQ